MEKVNWKYEITSTVHTFIAILTGSLLASPLINALLGTDLPTIQQFHDIVPVLVDTVYRSAWLTVLTKLGLSHRQTIDKNDKNV